MHVTYKPVEIRHKSFPSSQDNAAHTRATQPTRWGKSPDGNSQSVPDSCIYKQAIKSATYLFRQPQAAQNIPMDDLAQLQFADP